MRAFNALPALKLKSSTSKQDIVLNVNRVYHESGCDAQPNSYDLSTVDNLFSLPDFPPHRFTEMKKL